MLRSLRRLRWVAALVPALVVQTALADGPINCDPCPPVPCPAPAVARPRIVVHVPTPEVIIQNECSHVMKPRARLFGGHCNTCCGKQNQQQQSLVQTTLTPLSMTSFGSLGMFGASMAQANMQLTPVQTVQAVQQQVVSEDFAGLRAIHDAEIRTASIVAARVRQDAELRATMSALDRARASMNSTLSCESTTGTKEAITAAKLTAESVGTLAKQLGSLDDRLSTLEKHVAEMRDMQLKMAQKIAEIKK